MVPIGGGSLGETSALLLLAAYLVSFIAATPGYLSYFNFVAGGSEGDGRYLLDSNLDWGQDLPGLRPWPLSCG